jgi:hypothetical protein
VKSRHCRKGIVAARGSVERRMAATEHLVLVSYRTDLHHCCGMLWRHPKALEIGLNQLLYSSVRSACKSESCDTLIDSACCGMPVGGLLHSHACMPNVPLACLHTSKQNLLHSRNNGHLLVLCAWPASLQSAQYFVQIEHCGSLYDASQSQPNSESSNTQPLRLGAFSRTLSL